MIARALAAALALLAPLDAAAQAPPPASAQPSATSAPPAPAAPPPGGTAAPAPAVTAAAVPGTTAAATPGAAGAPSPGASTVPGSAPAPAGAPRAQTSSPTEEEEERKAAERALERALVQKGGLVVAPWGIELVPELSFSYADGTAPAAASAGGGVVGARTEMLTGSLTLRVGLPFDLQVEGEAPFVLARLTPGDDAADAAAVEGSGLGDVRLGLTWHALRGRSGIPDVLVGGFWKSRSGKTAFDERDRRVPLGTGIEQFGATLALVKAVDPVVLLATGTYGVSVPRWIPEGWLEAGDTFGGSAGAVLAVSPETSLSFALEAQHARPLRLDGVTVYRSDRTSALFRVGVATMASRRGFFQVSLGMGLTSDVPQFEIAVATPIQL